MQSVSYLVIFLATLFGSVEAMEPPLSFKQHLTSGECSLQETSDSIDLLNGEKKQTLKNNLRRKYSNPHNADTIGAKLRTSFTTRDIRELNTMSYRPRNTMVGGTFDKKTISIVTRHILEPEQQTHLAWYQGTPYALHCTEYATYIPLLGTQYRMIHANKDGTLVAVGYDDGMHLNDWINQVDIIDARNPALVKKLMTLTIPHNDNLLNMQFVDDNKTLLTRTKNALYAWDLDGVLVQRVAIDKATQVVQNLECTTKKELACALFSLERSSNEIKKYYQKKQVDEPSGSPPQIVNTTQTPQITHLRICQSISFARLVVTAGLLFTLFPQPVY